MIKRQRFFSQLVICIVSAGIFVFFMAFISPRILFLGKFDAAQYMSLSISTFAALPEMNIWIRSAIAAVVFVLLVTFTRIVIRFADRKIEEFALSKEKTKLFADFVDNLKLANTGEDFVTLLQKDLEYAANCEVVLVETATDFVSYNCGSRFTSDPETFDKINTIFKKNKAENGVHFFDNHLYLVNTQKNAKGFALITEKFRLIVICRFLKDVEPGVFPAMYHEFVNFEKRSETLAKLLELSEFAQEWQMIADIQMSFLPKEINEVKHLDIAAYYRPLLNVSGDYYDYIPVDEDKTIFVVGDVSGKGLPAALIMGVVINTIRIAPDKEDLEGVLRMVDVAIKRMNLIDKYTVLFLSLIDTKKMTIKYINASIENPMILTQSAGDYKIKSLDSTCGVIGIIDLDEIEVVEKPLYRGDVIIMSTDGVPETPNDQGVELGETDEYIDALKSYADKTADQIVHNIANLAFSYATGSKVRDDITVVAVKVKG